MGLTFVLPLKRLDLALIHAPSVYDFRKSGYVHHGPIGDVIPSKPTFDYVSCGFLFAGFVSRRKRSKDWDIQRRCKDGERPDVDVARLIRQIDAKVYGIDLHWLVHSHGALELAKLVKELTGRPVILGGFTATYYWREVLENPFVDVVVLGDAVELLYQLLQKLEKGRLEELEEIPNVAYRADGG